MRFFIAFLIVIFSSGCAGKEPVAIRIDDVEISKNEFLQAYQKSPFYFQKNGDPNAFLDPYVSQKVILREAERLGLDRDPQFLVDVQQYWEQGLLKLMLTQKNQELSRAVAVGDSEIETYFDQNKETHFAQKTLDDVRQQIKAFLVREKQKAALQKWVDDLKKESKIEIDQQQLQ